MPIPLVQALLATPAVESIVVYEGRAGVDPPPGKENEAVLRGPDGDWVCGTTSLKCSKGEPPSTGLELPPPDWALPVLEAIGTAVTSIRDTLVFADADATNAVYLERHDGRWIALAEPVEAIRCASHHQTGCTSARMSSIRAGQWVLRLDEDDLEASEVPRAGRHDHDRPNGRGEGSVSVFLERDQRLQLIWSSGKYQTWTASEDKEETAEVRLRIEAHEGGFEAGLECSCSAPEASLVSHELAKASGTWLTGEPVQRLDGPLLRDCPQTCLPTPVGEVPAGSDENGRALLLRPGRQHCADDVLVVADTTHSLGSGGCSDSYGTWLPADNRLRVNHTHTRARTEVTDALTVQLSPLQLLSAEARTQWGSEYRPGRELSRWDYTTASGEWWSRPYCGGEDPFSWFKWAGGAYIPQVSTEATWPVALGTCAFSDEKTRLSVVMVGAREVWVQTPTPSELVVLADTQNSRDICKEWKPKRWVVSSSGPVPEDLQVAHARVGETHTTRIVLPFEPEVLQIEKDGVRSTGLKGARAWSNVRNTRSYGRCVVDEAGTLAWKYEGSPERASAALKAISP